MPKIAFFTQVRNGEATLGQTIQSVLGQTEGDFVYYIADDGSTDGTRGMIERAAGLDGRVRPVRFGQADMRAHFNQALCGIYDHSGADFLAIVDGDDWLEPTFAAVLLAAAEACDADMAAGRFVPHNEAGVPVDAPLAGFGRDTVFTLAEFCAHYYIASAFPTALQWWGKLMRLAPLRQRRLLAGPAWDMGFCVEQIALCRRLAFVEPVLLHYRVREGSHSRRALSAAEAEDQRAGLALLHRDKTALLRQAGADSGHNAEALALQDLRGGQQLLQRLPAAGLSPQATCAQLRAVLALPFLPPAWATVAAGWKQPQGLLGLPAEQGGTILAELSAVYLEAVLLLLRANPPGPEDALPAAWAAALCPDLAAAFSPEELAAIGRHPALGRPMLFGAYRDALGLLPGAGLPSALARRYGAFLEQAAL